MVNSVRILLSFVPNGTEIFSAPLTCVRGPGREPAGFLYQLTEGVNFTDIGHL